VAFPQTILPLVSQLLIDGVWTTVTTDVRREDGAGVQVSRRPLSWGEQVAPTSANWIFKNSALKYSLRNANSANYGKIGRNTQVRHYINHLADTFARTASSSWGPPDVGPVWTTSGGSASDHSVAGGVGKQSLGTRAVDRIAKCSTSLVDFDITFDASNPVTPTGGVFERGIRGRWVDGNNFIDVRIFYGIDNSVSLIVRQVVAGVETTSGFTTISGLTTTSAMTGRFQARGDLIRATLYATGGTEPTTWDSTFTTTHLTAGTFEFYSQLSSGSTNALPVVQTWDNIEIRNFRFWGKIPNWSQETDSTSSDRTAPVVAFGLGQFIGAGSRSLSSALTRAMDGVSEGDFVPLAHWPLEDASGTTKPGNLVAGGAPAQVSGDVSMASYSGADGSDSVPVFGAGGQIAGTFPTTALTADGLGQQIWQYQFMGMVPSSIAADSVFLDISVPDTGGAHIVRLRVQWVNSFRILTLRPYDKAGVQVGTGSALDFSSFPILFDKPVLYGISIFTSSGSPGFVAGSFAAFLPGLSDHVTFGVNSWSSPTIPVPRDWRAYGNTANAGWSFSHAAYYTDPSIITESNQQNNADAIDGYNSELAGVRLLRLGRETGTSIEIIGDSADTHPCGPQRPGKLLELLTTAADPDQGVLADARDSLSITYRTRTSLYNTTASTTFSQTGTKDLSRFRYVDDDKTVRNRITARRDFGSFAVSEITEGGTSTSEPPDGIGIIPEDLTWSLSADDELPAFAGWRAHRMSWDEPRYPVVGIDRTRSTITSSADKDAAVLALDLGGHYALTDMRSDLPPDDVQLLVQGYDERLANFEHEITFDNYPQKVYRVFTLDQDRLDGDHFLRTAVNTSATSWEIATASGPVLDTIDADDGQSWKIDAEIVTVTDIAASSITFVAAGTASTGSSGSRTPGAPAGIASGDLVLILASTRNSGTGVPVTPTDWTRFTVFDAASNVQVFGRIYDGVWTMPTVTITGGAANEDTIAQSAAFRGKFHDISRIYVTSVGRLNASAQDIIAPGVPLTQLPDDFMAIHCCWKQDDFTSAAPAASWTEIQEASTTAGNDASQVWAYRQFTSRPAANTLQPTYTITGGASAISRGGVLIIASDYQIVTVTRGVDGVTTAHAAGAVPHLDPAPYLAL
jgi:hypothetical protein